MKVLLVDDEPLLVKMLARNVRTRGHEPIVAHDGQEAWELFCAAPDEWDVLVTDIIMPRMDGVSLVERVRRTGCGVPVVFISAHGAIPDMDRLSPATFLPKPFLRADLLRAIEASAQRGAP